MAIFKKVLIGALLSLALVLALFSIIVYAKDEAYPYSYTKAVKYCVESDVCMIQDFVVHCLDDRVVGILPLPEPLYIEKDFVAADPFGWCE